MWLDWKRNCAHTRINTNTDTISQSYSGPLSLLGNLFTECWTHLRENLIETGANLMMPQSGRALNPASPPVRLHLVVLTLNTLLLHFMPHGSMRHCALIHATLIVNPTFDMHSAHSILILLFLFVSTLLLFTPHQLPNPCLPPPFPSLFIQDGYYSHRPKEKSKVDSNNENSVPKDFENIDNSNFGARSQPHRQSVGATSSKQRGHLQEKAHAQQQAWRDSSPSLGRSSNEVLPVGHQPLAVGNNASYPGGQGVAGVSHQQYRASQAQQAQSQHRHQHPHRRQATAAPLEVTYDQPPKCEISGKEAISALSRAKSKECRQQIAEVYCRHKEGQLMPEKVTRYCPLEGE